MDIISYSVPLKGGEWHYFGRDLVSNKAVFSIQGQLKLMPCSDLDQQSFCLYQVGEKEFADTFFQDSISILMGENPKFYLSSVVINKTGQVFFDFKDAYHHKMNVSCSLKNYNISFFVLYQDEVSSRYQITAKTEENINDQTYHDIQVSITKFDNQGRTQKNISLTSFTYTNSKTLTITEYSYG